MRIIFIFIENRRQKTATSIVGGEGVTKVANS